MPKSGLKHIDVGAELSKTEWESEDSHELIHGTSFPGSPVERQLFYRDDEHKWYIYDGSAWVWLGGGSGGGMEVHGNEYHDPDFEQQGVAATLIETHRTTATHTQDQPAAEHGNEKHNPDFATEAALASHAAAATGVHGVGGSSVESIAGSQAKVDAHKDLTTGVHGAGSYYLLNSEGVKPIAGEIIRQNGLTAPPPFTGTISGTPTTTSVSYTPTSGEGSLIGISSGSAYWGRLRLYNSTRGTYRRIVTVNTDTNVITTESSSDSWANGDSLTTQSQVNAEAGYVDIDLSAQVPANAYGVWLYAMYYNGTGAPNLAFTLSVHPYKAFDLGLRSSVNACLAGEVSTEVFPMEVVDQKITIFPRSAASVTNVQLLCKGIMKS